MAIAGPSGIGSSTACASNIADDKYYDKIYFDSDDDENDDEDVGESGICQDYCVKTRLFSFWKVTLKHNIVEKRA